MVLLKCRKRYWHFRRLSTTASAVVTIAPIASENRPSLISVLQASSAGASAAEGPAFPICFCGFTLRFSVVCYLLPPPPNSSLLRTRLQSPINYRTSARASSHSVRTWRLFTMTQTILILGGSYGGLHIAHYLLKKNEMDVKVILVSKNSHFYWNMASVRAVVPGQIKSEEILQPLVKALSRYPRERWDLIVGTAERADLAAKTVTLSTASGTQTLSYDQLVIATGSRCPDTNVPWKANETYDAVITHLRQTGERVQKASHIVVAGAGATGIELAGEFGFEYGKSKEVVLLCSGDELLGGDSVGVAAEAELRKLNVVIRKNSYVTNVNTRPDGKTDVILREGGPPIVTDLYMPTMGMVPNSEYIDSQHLTANKTVDVDEYFRVRGLEDVWACGDIVSKPRSGFLITQKHAGSVAKNIEAVLKGSQLLVVKDPPDILSCAVGRSRGAGRFNSFKLPSLGVWIAKGRTLGVQMMPSYMSGSVA